MRGRCQDECGADVNIMRSLCQGEYEADVKTNAKPMSRPPRNRCREGINAMPMSRTYVGENAKPMSRLMGSLCQEDCEAYVKINAKPMSRLMRSLN